MLEEQATPQMETQEEETLLGFTYENKDGEFVELSPLDQEKLVQQITRSFDRFDQQRADKKRIWKEVERVVKGIVSDIDTDRFYALVPFGKQTVQTLVSHFWGRSLQSQKIFFSVEGLDEPSKENAPIYKQSLLMHMEKDRVRQKLDKGIYLHALMKGVVIAHVGVATKKNVLPWSNGQTDESGKIIYQESERTILDGATLTIVDPYDFVFDPDNHEDWDACFKALQKWMIYEDIAADPNFSNYEELYELCAQKHDKKTKTSPLRRKKDKQKPTSGTDESGRLEVIEFHGDIRLPDGTYLRNWCVTVGGRKKIIKFEKNACYINPFTKWEFEPSEDGWSIPTVAYILGLIDASSILLSSGVEANKMSINPPIMGPEGAFQQKKHFMREGMFISYKPNPNAPGVAPTPLTFKYDAPFPYLQLFETQAESTTGATRQLSGNVTSNDNVQTATEFQGLQVVGNLILDRLVDLFNLDLKIPVIEKIALLNAMSNPESKTVPIDNDKGVREFKDVTPEMYFGNYEYKIEDNKSELERKQNIREKLEFIKMLSDDPITGPRLKKIDLSKEYLADMGYGNPGKYFMDDNEYVMWAAQQNAIVQEIEIMTQQRLAMRMQAEGMMPDAEAVAGLLGAAQGAEGPPADPGMEVIQ